MALFDYNTDDDFAPARNSVSSVDFGSDVFFVEIKGEKIKLTLAEMILLSRSVSNQLCLYITEKQDGSAQEDTDDL